MRNLTAVIAASVLQLGLLAATQAAESAAPQIAPIVAGSHTSFGPLKHIKAGLLDVAYAEAGPADGPVVILLHGWPYDIHSYADVAPALAAQGYRVLIPYARGYGETRFLSPKTLRNGQPAALAQDLVDFMDALKIKQAVLGVLANGRKAATKPECKVCQANSGPRFYDGFAAVREQARSHNGSGRFSELYRYLCSSLASQLPQGPCQP